MEEKKKDIEEYLKDLTQIKKMMDVSEDYGVIENWVYWVYGILTIAASALSYYLMSAHGLTRFNVFLAVWLPMFALSGTTEAVGWILRMDKLSAPLFTSRVTKIWFGFAGPMVILGIMMYFLLHSDIPHAGFYMMAGAVPLFMYSQVTYTSLSLEAWVLCVGGILLILNHVSSLQNCFITGIVVGLVYIVAGFHTSYLEKKIDG